MAKEIERKFLVAGDAWRAQVRTAVSIRQFYVAIDAGRSILCRIKDAKDGLLTLKFGTDARMRDEFEYPIPIGDALEMRRFALGRVIEKTRNIVPHGRHVFEVDEFHGDLAPLVIAELETAEDVPDTALPRWLGREVTGEAAYYNASLARAGLPADRA
jgi:CYTH domain-containing protein